MRIGPASESGVWDSLAFTSQEDTMNKVGVFILVFCVLLFVLCSETPKKETDWSAIIEQSLTYAAGQMKKTAETIQDSTQFPRSIEHGQWITTKARGWTSGFFPGCLWFAFEYTGDDWFRTQAARWTDGLVEQQTNDGTHDTGFMIFCSYGNGYRLTKNPDYKPIILKTAETLASRFNPKVGCIKSWDWMKEGDFPVIIDNMMNLELLFWASRNGGQKEWYDIAVKHADTTIRNHIREDGSCPHVVNYNPKTGAVVEKKTHQGAADHSAWSRGQAWGIYGYTMTYRETREIRFLEAAKAMADYFIAYLPEDYVPFWDFDAPDIPLEPKDASAAAIAASGMIELSGLCKNPELKSRYLKTARLILKNLASPAYLTKTSGKLSVLDHSTGSKPGDSEVDVPIIYADYYFLEALLRLKAVLKAESESQSNHG